MSSLWPGTVAEPDAAAIPIHLTGDDLADDVLLLDLLEGFDVAVLIAALKADDDLEVLFVCDFGHSCTLRTPGASTATGFSMKMFFPALTAASKW
jgi:hypothetical protein